MKADKALDYVSWTLISISIVLLGGVSSFLENIIQGKKFVFDTAICGVILASVWMFLLYRLNRGYFSGGELRASAVLAQFFSIIVFTLFGSCFYNYFTGRSNTVVKTAIVASKSINASKGTRYVRLRIDGGIERFSPKNREYDSFENGDTIDVLIGRGQLGYEFIMQFKSRTPKIMPPVSNAAHNRGLAQAGACWPRP